VFHFVNGQRPREQLDFVTEKFKDNCAGQGAHVHEHALPERNVERARARLRPSQARNGIGARIKGGIGKNDPHVPDGEFGLVNRQHWRTRFVIGEGNLPWSTARAMIFNRPIGDDVNHERSDKDRDRLFENSIRRHVPFTLRELKPGVKLPLARERAPGDGNFIPIKRARGIRAVHKLLGRSFFASIVCTWYTLALVMTFTLSPKGEN
jgi:hypothetical protein